MVGPLRWLVAGLLAAVALLALATRGVAADAVTMPFRAAGDYFEVRHGSRWEPLFVQGVNLGAALPGKFPSEFPEREDTYAEWLRQMGAMGANVVRLYTIHPPQFYRALAAHNRSAATHPLWLVQGVWTELPPGDDFTDPAFEAEFRQEIARAVDVLHGQAEVPARPGHASGHYQADVSGHTLALLLGREWEPTPVQAFNAAHAGLRCDGAYVRVRDGSPFEAWLGRQCDYAVSQEMERYHAQRPVSFVNWPTLDPLHHPTETSRAEEAAWMERRGESVRYGFSEYDNDGASVSVRSLRPTLAFPAGVYAAYHAYPYYPDFMNFDPGYRSATGSHGASNYLGYLRDLKRHYAGLPLLIAEYGVPSSRGVAHLQPQGWSHGGHDERQQAEIDGLLTDDIVESGCAGGVIFAWLDEWFKHNWLAADREIPAERTRLWHNAQDPEQYYGMLALDPGRAGWKVTLRGDPAEWGAAACVARSAAAPGEGFGDGGDAARHLLAMYADSDEAYLYLRLDVERLDRDAHGAVDFSRARYLIALDTCDRYRGDHRLPCGLEARTRDGFDFVLTLGGREETTLRVTAPYQPWRPVPIRGTRGEYVLVPNRLASPRVADDADYRPVVAETNRRRIGRDGAVYAAQRVEWGRLREGTLDPRAADYDTRCDWHASAAANCIEIRIPWALLNVTDPSARRVLDDHRDAGGPGTSVTDGFRFLAVSYRPSAQPPHDAVALPSGRHLADALPSPGADSTAPLESSALFAWPTWEEPTWHARLKPAYFLLSRKFQALGGRPPARTALPKP